MKDIWILITTNRFSTFENKKIINYIKNNKLTNFKILDPKRIIVKKENNKQTQYYYSNNQNDIWSSKTEIITLDIPWKVFPKLGCMLDSNDQNLLFSLQLDKVLLINSLDGLINSADKFKTLNILHNQKIKTINSFYLNGDSALNFGNYSFLNFPLIIKSKNGSLGLGIYKINTASELENIFAQINLLDKTYEFLIQEYIPEGNTDYRVMVLNGKIEYIAKTIAQNEEFRSNYALGSKVDFIDKNNSQIQEIVDKIYKIYNLNVMGIDLFKVKGEYIVCEINANPGYKAYDDKFSNSFTSRLIDSLGEK